MALITNHILHHGPVKVFTLQQQPRWITRNEIINEFGKNIINLIDIDIYHEIHFKPLDGMMTRTRLAKMLKISHSNYMKVTFVN